MWLVKTQKTKATAHSARRNEYVVDISSFILSPLLLILLLLGSILWFGSGRVVSLAQPHDGGRKEGSYKNLSALLSLFPVFPGFPFLASNNQFFLHIMVVVAFAFFACLPVAVSLSANVKLGGVGALPSLPPSFALLLV